MAFVYHGTPLTPDAAFKAVMPARDGPDPRPGRGACVSFYRPDIVASVEEHCPWIMYDPGTASPWFAAMRAGLEWDYTEQDPRPYYEWLEQRLFEPGRWAIIYDVPGAPSQYNDGFLNDFPFGRSRGAPVWHMDGPIDRLARFCERYDRVCLGWIGDPKREPVGCDAYCRKMDEVAALFGNRWPPTHMLRGVAVGGDYPFLSCDSTSLAQNHHRYRMPLFAGTPDEWSGVRAYADRLERLAA